MSNLLSSREKEILEELIEYQKETNILDSSSQLIDIIFVLCGEKSGTHIVDSKNTISLSITKNKSINIPEVFIPFKTTRIKQRKQIYSIAQKLDNIKKISIKKNQRENSILIYNTNKINEEHLKEVCKTSGSKQNNIIIGEYYGYPIESRKSFNNNINKNKSNLDILLTYLENSDKYTNNKENYLQATTLTNYVSAPTENSINKIITTNKNREKILYKIKDNINKNKYPNLYEYITNKLSKTNINSIYK